MDLSLIHGPPGTGKTRTLVEIIRQEVRSGNKVLFSAASNTAVDNMCERLQMAGLNIVRWTRDLINLVVCQLMSLIQAWKPCQGYRESTVTNN